jgi:hypothetical protein
MTKFFIGLLKGFIGLIWIIATLLAAVILSPFILAAWISKLLTGKKKEDYDHDGQV